MQVLVLGGLDGVDEGREMCRLEIHAFVRSLTRPDHSRTHTERDFRERTKRRRFSSSLEECVR